MHAPARPSASPARRSAPRTGAAALLVALLLGLPALFSSGARAAVPAPSTARPIAAAAPGATLARLSRSSGNEVASDPSTRAVAGVASAMHRTPGHSPAAVLAAAAWFLVLALVSTLLRPGAAAPAARSRHRVLSRGPPALGASCA